MRRSFVDEVFINRATNCGKNCIEKDFRACVFSDLSEDNAQAQDSVIEYGNMIFNRCIIENRLLYGDLWVTYMDYRNETLYYKLPFLIAFMLQIMNTDKELLRLTMLEAKK